MGESPEAAAQREQATLTREGRDWQSNENLLAFQRAMNQLTGQNLFTSSEAEKARAGQLQQQNLAQTYGASESEKARAAQLAQQQLAQQFGASESEKARQFSGNQSQIDRDIQAQLRNQGLLQAQGAEQGFLSSVNAQNPYLSQLQASLQNQNTFAQQQNRRQMEGALARQGVRGARAATLVNRGAGQLNTDLQNQLNSLTYNDALNRQNQRSSYYQNKAQQGYQRGNV